MIIMVLIEAIMPIKLISQRVDEKRNRIRYHAKRPYKYPALATI
jgi:hypothetical protein